jgi:hypothetical protein
MLIPSQYNQKGIFEKIIHSKDGRLMRVTFEIYEFNGELSGRILKAEPVLELAHSASERMKAACALILCAPAKIISPYFWNIEKRITSPFSDLQFLSNIKIRAPSL